jgi:hypothetical protein
VVWHASNKLTFSVGASRGLRPADKGDRGRPTVLRHKRQQVVERDLYDSVMREVFQFSLASAYEQVCRAVQRGDYPNAQGGSDDGWNSYPGGDGRWPWGQEGHPLAATGLASFRPPRRRIPRAWDRE